MSKKTYFNLFLIILLFNVIRLNGQTSFVFDKLSSDKGLSQSIIYAVSQDKIGNIWLATEEGVVRYNSKDAFVYDRNKGLPNTINNRILCLFIDSNDKIWIGTENGICLFNKEFNKFERISEDLISVPVKKIIQDESKNIIFGTEMSIWQITHQFDKYIATKRVSECIPESLLLLKKNLFYSNQNGAFILNLNNNISSKIPLLPESIYKQISSIKIIEDIVFIGTKKGQLFGTDFNFSKITKILEIKSNTIKDIIKYNNNYYVAVDGGGIIVLNSNLKKIKQYFHDEDISTSLSSNGVYNLFVDKQGLFWVTTFGGGLNIYNPLKSNFTIIRHIINKQNSLHTNFCTSFLDVGNNIIWFGTKNGISIWNRISNQWKYIKSLNNNDFSDNVLTMTLDGDNVWVGTYNNGLYKVNLNNFNTIHYDINEVSDKKIGVSKVFKVFMDSSGTIWVGGIDGKLTSIQKNNKITIFNLSQVRDIFQDGEKGIICVGRNGVHLVNKINKLSEITTLTKAKKKFDFVSVNCGILNKRNQYVFGTKGGGVLFYDPKKNTISKFTTENNLPSDVVQGIIELNKDQYWVITTKGLSLIKTINNISEVINFNQSDGLASNEFNNKAIAKLKSNEIIVGGISGVTLFDPSKIQLQKDFPKVVFEDLLLFNKVVKPGEDGLVKQLDQTKNLVLKYSQNSIEIRFAGILYGFNSKVKYTWILEGFDDKWSEPDYNTQVNYTNLNHGDYIFKVKASNKDGIWGEIRTLNITIKRPWYATIVAYFIYFVLFLGLFFVTIYFTKLLEIKKNREEQINMLNNITHEIKTPLSILISSLENYENDHSFKKNKLQPTIDRLNSLIKQMLNFNIVTSENYKPNNVDKILVKQYFHDIILDFKPLLENKKLNIELTLSNNVEVLYFEKEDFDKIIFNLISNAIKYSFENNKLDVNISKLPNGTTIIKIRDYGMGIPKDQQKFILNNYYRARNVANSQHSGSGLGLMIVKNLIVRNNGKIFFESEENIGTTFTVELPSQEKLYAAEMLSNQTELVINVEKEFLEKYSNYKILIVEDNEELRKNLVKSLENYFLVYEAVNGEDGLEKVKQIYPDLILTDYIMPTMDGIQMCYRLKEDINLNHIPIFMMTVLQNSKHKQESIETGITEYLEKPLNINILLAKINNLFQWQKILKQRYLQEIEVIEAERFKAQKDSIFIERLESIILDKVKDETFSLSDICQKIGMSRTSLYMKLKSLIDVSPQDFIILTKLKYSKKMIIEGNTNIKEVAYASGFANPKYFSTSFKKMFGVSPSQYIKDLSQPSK